MCLRPRQPGSRAAIKAWHSSGVLLVLNQAKAPFWVSHPINTSISSANIINAKQGFGGSLISRNMELSSQKPLKRSCDLQGWSVAEQYIHSARSESRLATMTFFQTTLKKDCTSFIWRDRAASIRRWLRSLISIYFYLSLSDSLSSTTSSLSFWGNTIHRPPIVTHSHPKSTNKQTNKHSHP